MSPVDRGLVRSTGSAQSCVHMRNFISVTKMKKARGAWNINERWRHVNIFRSCHWPLSTGVTLLLQLNDILLKWKIGQISQNIAAKAAKRPFSHMRS